MFYEPTTACFTSASTPTPPTPTHTHRFSSLEGKPFWQTHLHINPISESALSLALLIPQYSLYLAPPSPAIHSQCQSIGRYLCSLSHSDAGGLCSSHEQSVSNNSGRELDSSTLCQLHFGAQSDEGDMLFLPLPLCSLSIFPHSFVSCFPSLTRSFPLSVHSASPQTS